MSLEACVDLEQISRKQAPMLVPWGIARATFHCGTNQGPFLGTVNWPLWKCCADPSQRGTRNHALRRGSRAGQHSRDRALLSPRKKAKPRPSPRPQGGIARRVVSGRCGHGLFFAANLLADRLLKWFIRRLRLREPRRCCYKYGSSTNRSSPPAISERRNCCSAFLASTTLKSWFAEYTARRK